MTKSIKIYITLSLVLIISVFGVCFGFEMGLPKIIRKKTDELIEKAWIERETRFDVKNEEWSIIDDELVILGTGDNGEYIMWPRKKTCAATNNASTKRWATGYYPVPTWDNKTKKYNYGLYSRLDYPAFVWVENLVYKGYDDWRLPTMDELRVLYNYGGKYVEFSGSYVSTTERDYKYIYWFGFESGVEKYYYKNNYYFVIALRTSD